MGDISPVLAAFFEGQKLRSDILNKAQRTKQLSEEQKLRQQQLDETIRQFNEKQKQDQKLFDLRTKEFEASRAARMGEYEHQFLRDVAAGIRKPSSTKVQQPGRTDMVAIPGGGFAESPSSRTTEMVDPNQVVDSPYGQIIIPGVVTPEELDSRAFQQASRVKEMQEATESKYKQQEIAMSNEARTSQLMERLHSAEEIAKERNATNMAMAELRAQLAGMKSGADREMKLMLTYGDTDEARIMERAKEDANKVRLGYMDLTEAGTKGNQTLVSRMLGESNMFGKKNRTNLETVSSAASKLINQVEELHRAVSSPSSTGGVLGNLIQRYNPRSLVNQKLKQSQALIPDIAHAMGIASKQFDSNKEADRILNSLIQYVDRPDVRQDKLIDIRDRPLAAMQSVIGQVADKDTRRQLWGQVLNDNPSLLKQRLQYRPVYDKIMETGSYDTSYWDPVRKAVGAR